MWIIIIIIIIIYLLAIFFYISFLLVVFHGRSSDSKSSQVQDSSEYSGWYWQCFGLYGLDNSSDLWFLQFFFPSIWGLCPAHLLDRHLHVPHLFFSSLERSKNFSIFSLSFIKSWNGKINQMTNSSFFFFPFKLTLDLSFWLGFGGLFYYHYYYYYYFVPWEFFISAFAGGLSLECEWQQVSASLHDSSQYSDRS